ncbi:MAG: tetratricopeptide repeat protein [Gammaproteobacteria bacterium]
MKTRASGQNSLGQGEAGVLMIRQATLSACLMCILHTAPRADVEFWPTQSEFWTLPNTATGTIRVTVSERGKAEYSRMMPNGDRRSVETAPWTANRSIHHHCFGLIWLQRAMVETDPRQHDYDLKTARNESLFTFERVDSNRPIFAEIAGTGHCCAAQKDYPEADRFYDIAIQTHPDYPGGYQGKALVLQDHGDWAEARDILLQGNNATEGKSPKINYFLGLTLVHLKDY